MNWFRRQRGMPDDERDADVARAPADDVSTYDERRAVASAAGWNPVRPLAVLAGAALIALGIVGLSRTELDESWYAPVVAVARIDHTALLAAIELGVGVVLVIAGLSGARQLIAVMGVAVAVAAAISAADPDLWVRELGIERWWSLTLAIGGAVLAVLALIPSRGTVRERRTLGVRRHGVGRAVGQH